MHDRPEHESPELGEHPRGTLAIVVLYALAFAAGWLLIYFRVFLPRGHVGG